MLIIYSLLIPGNGRKPLYVSLVLQTSLLVSRARRLRGLRFFSRVFTIFFVFMRTLEFSLIISPRCNFSSSSALRNFMLSSVGYLLFFF